MEFDKELLDVLEKSVQERGREATISRLRIPRKLSDVDQILYLWSLKGYQTIRVARVYLKIRDLSESSTRKLYEQADDELKIVIDKIRNGNPLSDIIPIGELFKRDIGYS